MEPGIQRWSAKRKVELLLSLPIGSSAPHALRVCHIGRRDGATRNLLLDRGSLSVAA